MSSEARWVSGLSTNFLSERRGLQIVSLDTSANRYLQRKIAN